MKEFWDIEENEGYISTPYKIRKHSKYCPYERTMLLYAFDTMTKLLQHGLQHLRKYPNIDIFCTTPHYFTEIHGSAFLGLNKPKEVSFVKHAVPVGDDGKLRATYRYVMLKLSGDANTLYKLYVHELAHTLCNHVTYRNDDHYTSSKNPITFKDQESILHSYLEWLKFPDCIKLIKKEYPYQINIEPRQIWMLLQEKLQCIHQLIYK
jgi:hypothetical protein